jgi:hypothetical protein
MLALSKEPNRVCVFLLSPEDGNRSSFRNAVVSSSYNSGRWTESTNPVILNVIHHRQNPLHSGRLYIFIWRGILVDIRLNTVFNMFVWREDFWRTWDKESLQCKVHVNIRRNMITKIIFEDIIFELRLGDHGCLKKGVFKNRQLDLSMYFSWR